MDNTTILGSLVTPGPHKPGQARFTRWAAALLLWALAVFGCAELYRVLAQTQTTVFACPDHRENTGEPGLCTVPECGKPRVEVKTPTWMAKIVFVKQILGVEILLRGAIYVALAVFAGSSWIIYRALHWARAGDFLIDMEGELRKVAWPARKEYMGASVVVIILTGFISVFLYGVDWLLSYMMVQLGIGI